MASFKQYTASGGASENFSIKTFTSDEIKVYVDDVLKTAGSHYNITSYTTNGGTVTWTSGNVPANPAVVRIVRDTDVSTAKATYSAGSSIKAGNLNDNQTQVLRSLEEQDDQLIQSYDIEADAITTVKIENSAVTTAKIADDAINGAKIADSVIQSNHYADGSIDVEHLSADSVSTAKIVDNAVTMAKLNSGALPTDITVASANIVDGTIVDADVASGAAIAHSKLAGAAGGKVLLGNSSNVVTATTVSGDVTISNSGVTAITAGSIVTADIGNDQIDSQHYAAGSIDLEHMSANSVDSDQYVDGSIDNAHIANATITGAKLVNDTVTATQIAADAITASELADNAVDTNAIQADAVTGAKIPDDAIVRAHIADSQINSEHYADGSIDVEHLSIDSVSTEKIVNANVTTAKIANDAVTADKIADAVIVTASEQAAATASDTTFFTTSASDARYFNVSTGDTIKDGQTFPDNDTTIATTAAINDRIIDLVDDVGGFVPIANETSFPNANPDVNNGAGTIVSVSTLASNHTSNGSGVISISNGTVGNSTVTINGAANSTTYSAGYGLLVETTSTLNTYTFHRLVPKATEVTTVAGKATEIGRLGTADAVADMNTLGTAAIVEDMNLLGTSAVVADMALLGDSAVIADMATIADTSNLISNIGTVAGIQANVTTVAGNNSNVTTVASNISNVNNFNDKYQIASSNPSTDGGGNALAEGDLYFNTSANELKVYNGSAWQGGVTASGNFASTTGNTFTGNNTYNDGIKVRFGTGNDLDIYHNSNVNYIHNNSAVPLHITAGAETLAKFTANGSVELYHDNSKKLETTSGGVSVTGNVATSGHVDLTDNNKLLLGTDDDIEFYSSGSHGYLTNNTGDLYIKSDAVYLKATNNENYLIGTANAAVELRYDNSKKFETTSTGSKIQGNLVLENTSQSKILSHTADGSDDNWLSINGGGDASQTRGGGITFWGNEATNNQGRLSLNAGNSGSSNGTIDFTTGGTTHAYMSSDGHFLFSNDSSKLKFGTGNDLQIYHDGTNSFIANDTGQLNIDGASGDAIRFLNNGTYQCNIGSTGLNFPDSKKARFGDSEDLEIYHDGSHSRIVDSGAGNLMLQSDRLVIANAGNSENQLVCQSDGAVELYHNGIKKLETKSDGVDITGELQCDSLDVDGAAEFTGADVTFYGASTNAYWDQSTNRFTFEDNTMAAFGSGQDLAIYHDGSNSYLGNATGDIIIENSGGNTSNQIYIRGKTGENSISIHGNGQVELYYDDSKKFETYASGTLTTGNLKNTGSVYVGNQVDGHDGNSTGQLFFGAGNDLKIYHDGSHNIFEGSNGADFKIKDSSNNSAIFDTSAGVELFYANSKKFETTSAGIQVTGTSIHSDNIKLTADNAKLVVGASDDMDIYHDGSNNHIRGLNGSTYVGAAANVELRTTDANGSNAEWLGRFKKDSSVELYYDNSKKLETHASGVSVFGQLSNSTQGIALSLADGSIAAIGTGDDIQLYHNSGVNYWKNQGSTVFRMVDTGGDTQIECNNNGATKLYHNGTWKLETKSGGVDISGTCTATSFSGSGASLTGISGTVTTGGNAGYWGIRAWGAFNGTNGGIHNDGNLTSISRHGSGDFTFNFSSTMPTSSYSFGGTCRAEWTWGNVMWNNTAGSRSTSSCRLYARRYATGADDSTYMTMQFSC